MNMSNRARDVAPGDIIDSKITGDRVTITIATADLGQRQIDMPLSSLPKTGMSEALRLAGDMALIRQGGLRVSRRTDLRRRE